MYSFTLEERRLALRRLVFFHIVIIAASNYLVQFPFAIGDIHATWGALSFPFIFVATDLTVRIFGKSQARKIVFYSMLPALLLSYAISVLFQDGHLTQLSHLFTFNLFVLRIVIASMLAYLFGQLLDIMVFNRLRTLKHWWIAPSASSILGCLADTFVFFSVAFFQSPDPYMASHWVPIAISDYAFKLVINLLFFLPIYGVVLRFVMNKLVAMKNDTANNAALEYSKSSAE
ncbi:MAG: 7-cyano-7-deazaguanine/7-aminomethyl-7-deazaguanine transporter [Neisseriaceae bacterium]|nr:7-cyano-7-deazaguanine/7-aminomethyl-7-deazaguanine transporter [Neisseriaceae bacterium]